MQIPIIPFRGQKKPWASIPRINWHHPLTRGMQTYCYDVGGFLRDLVSGGKSTTLLASGRTVTPFGSGYVYSATVGGYAMATVDRLSAAQAAPFTYCTGFYSTGAIAGNGPLFGLSDASGNNAMFAVLFSTTQLTYLFSNGGAGDIVGATVPAYQNKYSTAAGVAATTTSNVGYFNGLNVGSNAGSNAVSFSGSVPCFNSFTSTSSNTPGVVGNVFYGAIWNRALTQPELLQLHQDPWCFLIYPEDEMFATLVGVVAVATSEDRFHQPWSSVGRRYAIIAAG